MNSRPSIPTPGSSEQSCDVVNDQDPLSWVSDILWPDGSARLRAETRQSSSDGSDPRWWASPNPQSPQILIPSDAIAAARQAVHRYHDGLDLRRWIRSVAAEITMSSPKAAHRLLDDKAVVVEGPADATRRGVLGGLHDLFGHHDLRFAMSLAMPKTNRKPVIQILDNTGLVLGWAKVAWNSWTESLVANEARWLSVKEKPPIITPVVLTDSILGGRRVVVSSALASVRRPNLRRRSQPDPEVLLAVAQLGTNSDKPISESAWWASVEASLAVADGVEHQAVADVAAMTRHLRFSLGAWHGDFTPWNVMTARGLANIIDWEFAADEVPIGFDLCHFHTQVASEILHLSADDALDYSARLSPQGLALVGVDPHTQIATWRLYLVELLRRTLALRAAGHPTDNVHQGAAALRRLTRATQPSDQ